MFKRILVPIDSSELSSHAIGQGLALARQLGASVIGFVVEPLPNLPSMGSNLAGYQREAAAHEATTDAHAKDLLDNFSRAAADAGVAFEGHHHRHDDVARAIASLADAQKCDLIVMATHGRGSFGELLFGSHTKRVMSLTKRPLLVLH